MNYLATEDLVIVIIVTVKKRQIKEYKVHCIQLKK